MGPQGREDRVAGGADVPRAARGPVAGPLGWMPLPRLQGDPDRLPLLVHKLTPRKAGVGGVESVAPARGERTQGDTKAESKVLPDLLAGHGGLRGCFSFS